MKVHNRKSLHTAPTRRFWRSLIPFVRSGHYVLRVFGAKGEWYLGADRGNTIVRLGKTPFMAQSAAILYGVRFYGIKASVYKGVGLKEAA